MIQIERIDGMPPELVDELTDVSWKDWQAGGALSDVLIMRSDPILLLRDKESYPLMVVGIVQPSLCGSVPQIWALLFEHMFKSKTNWRSLHRLWTQVRESYPVLRTIVQDDNELSKRFVRFFGFVPINYVGDTVIYEAKSHAIH